MDKAFSRNSNHWTWHFAEFQRCAWMDKAYKGTKRIDAMKQLYIEATILLNIVNKVSSIY